MALSDVQQKRQRGGGYKATGLPQTDGYVRPDTTPAKPSGLSEVGEFLSKVSPTLEKYIATSQQVQEDLKTQQLIEQYNPKQVKDFDAIFQDPESFKKFAGDYNELTIAGQQKFGQMLGKKYAAATQLAVQKQMQDENWVDLDPDTFQKKMAEATKGSYEAFVKNNPQASTLPFFTQTFSDEMESHNYTQASWFDWKALSAHRQV